MINHIDIGLRVKAPADKKRKNFRITTQEYKEWNEETGRYDIKSLQWICQWQSEETSQDGKPYWTHGWCYLENLGKYWDIEPFELYHNQGILEGGSK